MEISGKMLIQHKKFVNRGFLIGPYCPIYGTGALLITLLLRKYTEDWMALFILTVVLCGTLEYLTSYIMEKLFHARWWDYSQRKFNINGRICLYTMSIFGILGLLIMEVLNPFFIPLIESLQETSLNFISIGLAIVFLVDIVISTNVVSYVGRATKEFGKDLDNTEEITKKVKEALLGKSRLYRRLLNAYPSIYTVKAKIKEKQKEIKDKSEEIKRKIKNERIF